MLNLKAKKNKKLDEKSAKSSSQNPKILEVNLIKDEMRESFDFSKHGKTLLLSLFITALFVAEIYLGLNWWAQYEEDRLASLENRFNAVSAEIRGMREDSDKVLAFRQRAETIDILLDNHVYWSNFFDWLEKNTISSVRYYGFSGEDDGNYYLEASTSNFRDISWQARVFLADPAVISVSINEGSGERDVESLEHNSDEIRFMIDLKIDPSIFNRK